jgi:3-deoxy-D-manno-octulosonate 8-phosphate phosphatase (KDO 8-P phosphatase)
LILVNIEDIFKNQGGEFISPPSFIEQKLASLKGLVFDWDGVFNNSFKVDNSGSPFSEADSMGLNMVRFSYFLKHGFIPKIFIITGENNLPALTLAKRESFSAVFLQAKHKTDTLPILKTEFNLKPEQLAFSFDDILDLGLAKEVVLRFMVKRNANPLLAAMTIKEGWVDYLTANDGGNFAVREICELIIGLNDNFEEVVTNRIGFTKAYQAYLALRNQQSPLIYSGKSGEIKSSSL